jgi:hypothetical protein
VDSNEPQSAGGGEKALETYIYPGALKGRAADAGRGPKEAGRHLQRGVLPEPQDERTHGCYCVGGGGHSGGCGGDVQVCGALPGARYGSMCVGRMGRHDSPLGSQLGRFRGAQSWVGCALTTLRYVPCSSMSGDLELQAALQTSPPATGLLRRPHTGPAFAASSVSKHPTHLTHQPSHAGEGCVGLGAAATTWWCLTRSTAAPTSTQACPRVPSTASTRPPPAAWWTGETRRVPSNG